MILHYFKKKENTEKKKAENFYKNILFQSNNILNKNNFFKEINYNSSFEIVSLILIIYIKFNIYFNIKNYKLINEHLINTFISDLDESLRIKGIGDMSIGKYVKSYVKKFYFRLSKFPVEVEEVDTSNFEIYLKNFEFIKNEKNIDASNIFYNVFKNIKGSFKEAKN